MVTVDPAGKDLVTVKGTMDVKKLVPYLKEKLNTDVEVVPAKKDEGAGDKKEKDGAGEEKKEKEAAGGEKKEKEAADGEKKEGGGGEAKMEMSKMEYYGYPDPPLPLFWHDGRVYSTSNAVENYPGLSHGYVHQGYGNQGYMNQGYMNQGYGLDPGYPHHAPQMFSDENPNACSIM
ncbi:hypothetical protein SLEP1_g55233 [Rubroshorea leprosula]|uniref:HMA domain-containing protein n=1 Tax=Rubroshorea leprosula TaxID=152421 RepID=A0AAV5MIY1_9ROSI|nr:hypothetical protein SLEP1_g55233 [Rubroshorea leprosula]